MWFPRQEYQSGLPFPSPGDLPDPGTKPVPSALEADSLPPSHQESPAMCHWRLPYWMTQSGNTCSEIISCCNWYFSWVGTFSELSSKFHHPWLTFILKYHKGVLEATSSNLFEESLEVYGTVDSCHWRCAVSSPIPHTGIRATWVAVSSDSRPLFLCKRSRVDRFSPPAFFILICWNCAWHPAHLRSRENWDPGWGGSPETGPVAFILGS